MTFTRVVLFIHMGLLLLLYGPSLRLDFGMLLFMAVVILSSKYLQPSSIGQGCSKRSGWSGYGQTNNRAGNLNICLVFILCLGLVGIINERVIFLDILFEAETTRTGAIN